MILSNTPLIDFIDSEDVKKYYIENKIDIKYDLIFFMIYNSNKTLSEKIYGFTALAKLIECCSDQDDDTSKGEVLNQIDSMINRLHTILGEMLTKNSDEIFELQYFYDKGKDEKYSFSSFNNALDYIKRSGIKCDHIRISKVKLSEDNDEDLHPIDEFTVIIDPKRYGIIYAWCDDRSDTNLYPEDPIEERYFPIPSPFKSGDVVKINTNYLLQMDYMEPESVYFILEDKHINLQYGEKGQDCECGFNIERYNGSTGILDWMDNGKVSPFKIEYDRHDYEADFNNIHDRIVSMYSKYLKGEDIPFMSIIPEIEKEILRIHGIENDIIV